MKFYVEYIFILDDYNYMQGYEVIYGKDVKHAVDKVIKKLKLFTELIHNDGAVVASSKFDLLAETEQKPSEEIDVKVVIDRTGSYSIEYSEN